jgi:hypothetical protein
VEGRDLVKEVADATFDRLWNGEAIDTGNEAADARINGAAASILATLGVWVFPAPKNEGDIRAIAARIKAMDIEVFMPKSQFPGDSFKAFKNGLGRVFGDKLRQYDDLTNLATTINNPEKSVVMTVNLSADQVRSVADSFDNLKDVRFVNFAPTDIKGLIGEDVYDNYILDALSILLAARVITEEEAKDPNSQGYIMLAHLLSNRIEGNRMGEYIRQIADNSIDPIVKLYNLVNLILKAMPIEAHKTESMKSALQTLWAA